MPELGTCGTVGGAQHFHHLFVPSEAKGMVTRMKNIAVITGSASGIGREIVRELNKTHLDELWLIDKNGKALEELQEEMPIPCKLLILDLSERALITKYEEVLKDENPNIVFLANGAGYGLFGEIGSVPLDEELGMIRVNCEALSAITSLSLPYIHEGGRIINIASSAAFLPIPKFNIYSPTKAYVYYFTRVLALQLKDKNIKVTVLCPGPVDTAFFDTANSHYKYTVMDMFSKTNPKDEARKALKENAKGRKVTTLGLMANSIRLMNVRMVPLSLQMLAFNKVMC